MTHPLVTPWLPLSTFTKVAAAYLIVAGLTSLLILAVGPLLLSLPVQEQFESQPWSQQVYGYLKAAALDLTYLAAGFGLFRRRPWAEKVAYLALVFGTLQGGLSIAWNWAGGAPNREIYLWSLTVAAVWNGLIAALLFRGMRRLRSHPG